MEILVTRIVLAGYGNMNGLLCYSPVNCKGKHL